MPTITFFLRFTHSDRFEIEEYEHMTEAEARKDFERIGPGDADIYSRVDLFAYNWKTRSKTQLGTKILNTPA